MYIVQRKALAALKTPKLEKQESVSEATKRRKSDEFNVEIVFSCRWILKTVIISS